MKSLFIHSKVGAIIKVSLISFTIYLLLIFGFGFSYYKIGVISTPQTEVKKEISKSRIFDNIYFSLVAFHTIGFGDYSPQNDEGKYILWIEAIISLLFHAIFSGIIVLIIIKRFPEIMISNFILLGLNDKGNKSLSIRLGNKGRNILDAKMVLMVYKFRKSGDGQRRYSIFEHTKDYHTILNKTTLLLRLDLSNRKNLSEKLIEGIENLNVNNGKRYEDIIQFVFAFQGIDETTGDFVGISKIFTEQHLKFGEGFEKVVGWNGINPLKRKKPNWRNFNSIINETNCQGFMKASCK